MHFSPKVEETRLYIEKMNVIRHFLQLFRIKQWTKNIFVFSGLLLSLDTLDWTAVGRSLLAFLLFCCISSSVYILNDMVDIEKDRLHPRKKLRPLPSGSIKLRHAVAALLLLGPCTLVASFWLNPQFGCVVAAYFLLNVSYCFKLKDYVFVDVIIISTGFVLRALSGIFVVEGRLSLWFLLAIAFLTLFLGLNKRKKEILTLAEGSHHHRKNLDKYSIALINEIIPMLTSCTILSYSFFIIYETGSKLMIVTIPMALYGILRYQYLTSRTDYGESPELVLLKDKPIVLIMLLWLVVYVSLLGQPFL
ncbi:decaprenyl-phosphate phosphoribosyltransferase [Paenibacillus athensensis]|nr:decaprenyl-phosphate phosphoribosyltransferase [Paenibacillus athensensis]